MKTKALVLSVVSLFAVACNDSQSEEVARWNGPSLKVVAATASGSAGLFSGNQEGFVLEDKFPQRGDFDGLASIGSTTWYGSGQLRATAEGSSRSFDWAGIDVRPVSRTRDHAYFASSVQGTPQGWTTYLARMAETGEPIFTSVKGNVANVIECGDKSYILAHTSSDQQEIETNFVVPFAENSESTDGKTINFPKDTEFRGKFGIGRCVESNTGEWEIVQLYQRESDQKYVLISIAPNSGEITEQIELSYDAGQENYPINAVGFPYWINDDVVVWADSNGVKRLEVQQGEMVSMWAREGAQQTSAVDYVMSYSGDSSKVAFIQQKPTGGMELSSFDIQEKRITNYGAVPLEPRYLDIKAIELAR